jgi:DNA-binding XRE family transcriptional regulator
MNNIDRIRKLRALQIRTLRTEKNLTQDQLAKLSGVDRKTIISIESGEKGWRSDSELLILEALKNYEESKL